MMFEPEMISILSPTPEDPSSARHEHINGGPGFLDAVAFFAIAACLMLAMQSGGVAVALHWHLFGGTTPQQLEQQPRFILPIMGFAYGCTMLIALALFPRAWNRPFAKGVCWNVSAVRKYAVLLLGVGIALAVVIQLASNDLPMPKEMPVDDFFHTPLDAWLVVFFGTLVAPAFEELAFRGFLYPALRRWSWTGMTGAAVLSSIPFALLHAQQLGHATSPLFLVFLVSMALTAVRQRTGSLAASTLVHVTYNLSIFVAMFLTSGGFQHLEQLKN